MSIKRIYPFLSDIRPPKKNRVPERIHHPKKKNRFIAKIIWSLVAVIFIALIFYIANILNFRNSVINSLQLISEQTQETKMALSELKTNQAINSLTLISGIIKTSYDQARGRGIFFLTNLIGKILPGTENAELAIKTLSLAVEKTTEITRTIDFLKNNGFHLLTNNQGVDIISSLILLKKDMEELNILTTKIKGQTSLLKNALPQFASAAKTFDKYYLAINLYLDKSENFLDYFIPFLESIDDQHILLIFQNPSEMRPAGGFIGSYGDIVLNKANLKEIRIDDIYNVDRQLLVKYIAPKELQGITKDWGSRDANWFTDFPTSAKKIIYFMEQSKMHHDKNITFPAAIAINTNVLGSLLEVTGPIELEKYKKTIDSKNYLEEIQFEIEAGQDKIPGQNPKRILSALTPIIFEKLGNLSDEQKIELLKKFQNHFEQKDIMLYFKDPKMEKLLTDLNVAGDIAQLPKNFQGDYLAVINANIAGGKTDAVISQDINLKSQILNDGRIINELTIDRTHNGKDKKDWWYKITNKNYIKILTPPDTSITSIQGNDTVPPPPAITYSKKYVYDPDLQLIEKSSKLIDGLNAWEGKEFDKKSFSAWFNTPAGKTKELTVGYTSDNRLNIQDGLSYSFIFDKQSGSQSTLSYKVTAPPGYIWKESGSTSFNYSTDQIKNREIIQLTLQKK